MHSRSIQNPPLPHRLSKSTTSSASASAFLDTSSPLTPTELNILLIPRLRNLNRGSFQNFKWAEDRKNCGGPVVAGMILMWATFASFRYEHEYRQIAEHHGRVVAEQEIRAIAGQTQEMQRGANRPTRRRLEPRFTRMPTSQSERPNGLFFQTPGARARWHLGTPSDGSRSVHDQSQLTDVSIVT